MRTKAQAAACDCVVGRENLAVNFAYFACVCGSTVATPPTKRTAGSSLIGKQDRCLSVVAKSVVTSNYRSRRSPVVRALRRQTESDL
jgi:hypothetical protein